MHTGPDTFFDNVCELDLVFNFYKVRDHAIAETHWINQEQVYAILDEIFLAGEVEETSKDVVLARLDELEKLE
jgi:AP-2 complex subunit sigma-1